MSVVAKTFDVNMKLLSNRFVSSKFDYLLMMAFCGANEERFTNDGFRYIFFKTKKNGYAAERSNWKYYYRFDPISLEIDISDARGAKVSWNNYIIKAIVPRSFREFATFRYLLDKQITQYTSPVYLAGQGVDPNRLVLTIIKDILAWISRLKKNDRELVFYPLVVKYLECAIDMIKSDLDRLEC